MRSEQTSDSEEAGGTVACEICQNSAIVRAIDLLAEEAKRTQTCTESGAAQRCSGSVVGSELHHCSQHKSFDLFLQFLRVLLRSHFHVLQTHLHGTGGGPFQH
jgi:hypothetical protein